MNYIHNSKAHTELTTSGWMSSRAAEATKSERGVLQWRGSLLAHLWAGTCCIRRCIWRPRLEHPWLQLRDILLLGCSEHFVLRRQGIKSWTKDTQLCPVPHRELAPCSLSMIRGIPAPWLVPAPALVGRVGSACWVGWEQIICIFGVAGLDFSWIIELNQPSPVCCGQH